MKKLLSLLLTAAMLCSMLAVFTVPAFAAPKADVGVVDITSDDVFRNTLTNLRDNQKIVLNLKKDICITNDEITISANNCSILIRVDSDFIDEGYFFSLKIYPAYRTDDHFRFLNIKGDNVKLFLHNIMCQDFDTSESGGAIFVDGENFYIASADFKNCTATESGGAIFVNKPKAHINLCSFYECRAVEEGGGAIKFNGEEGRVDECYFSNNSCANKENWPNGHKRPFESNYYGDDVSGYYKMYSDPETIVQNCLSAFSPREDNYYYCIVNPEEVPHCGDDGADEIFGTNLDNRYSRPPLSKYAQDTIEANEFCDAVRPDKADSVPSEKGYFTLNGKNFYGGTWSVSSESPLTITAGEGLLIERMEAIVDYTEGKFENLVTDKGTLSKGEKNSDAWNKDIVCFNDIYSPSVTVKTNGNIYNHETINFNEVIVYFVEDTPENRRTEAPEVSTEYTRDGETYDVFTFDRDTYTAGSGSVKSELQGFTLTDTAVPARGHIYGWATDITITAPEGYTITRIEGKPVHFENNVEYLKSNAGTIENQGKPLAKDGIVRINDINASSVEISCTSDYVEFDEFLVFYEKNATLASVFSGGTLWLIIGVAAVAVAAAVVIVVVMKKKKPTTADGAAAEKSEE